MRWIENMLNCQSQSVGSTGTKPSPNNVPQGPILDLIWFNILINYLEGGTK